VKRPLLVTLAKVPHSQAYKNADLLLQVAFFMFTLGQRLSSCSMCCASAAAVDVKIFWHPQGDYLAVKVDRFTKTKKSTYTGFELFRWAGVDLTVSCWSFCSRCCLIISVHDMP
jgi:hypothetical protein